MRCVSMAKEWLRRRGDRKGGATRREARGRGSRAKPTVEAVEGRICLSGLTPGLGVAYPANGTLNFYIDNTITGRTDITRAYGANTDIPVFGDFTGSTLESIGIYRPSTGMWALDLWNNGVPSKILQFGGAQWKPVTGDIDGNGTTDLGLYDPSTGVWLFSTNLTGQVTYSFRYGGSPGDIPLLEDFNHDGIDDPIIYNNGQWLIDTNADRLPDLAYNFGGTAPGATPLAFDLYGTHDPVLAVVAPQANGQLLWAINPNRDGRTIGYYQYGANGSIPFSGNFSTAGSLFVNPATGNDGAGAGGFASPFRTINAAVAAAGPGTTIRLMAGAYPENVRIVGKSDLKIVGTGLQSSIIYPASGDAAFVYNSSNISFDKLWFASTGAEGRGLVVVASSVNTGMIRTHLTRWIGMLGVSEGGRPATIVSRYSQFDWVQTGSGVYLQNGANATFIGCTFRENGYAADYRPDGGGLVVGGASTARIDYSVFIHNRHSGVIANSTSRVEMTNSYSARSILGNGAIFFDQTTAILTGNTFAENGVTFGPTTGLNGVEFFSNFTGYASLAQNNFLSNTASGIYLGSAPNLIQVVGNVFSGNWSGMTMFGDQPRAINLRIAGNYFATDPNRADATFGIAGIGNRINAQIGGNGGEQNIFDGFRDYLFINPSHAGGNPVQELGCPNFVILGNTFRRRGVAIPASQAVTPC